MAKDISLTRFVERVKASRFWQGTVVAFGVFIALLTFFYPKYLDFKDGKLGGQIVLGLDEATLNRNAPTYFFYAVPKDAGNSRYAVPIGLSLRNTSQARDTDVTLSIRYDKAYQRKIISDEFITHSGSRSATELSHEVNSNGRYDYSNYKIRYLTAGETYSISEGAFASRVMLDREKPALFTTDANLDIVVTTYSEKDIQRKWDIRYRGIRVDGDQGIEWYVKNWYSQLIALDIRKNNGFWQYLYRLIFSQDIVAYGYSPDFQYLPNLNLYFPKDQPEDYLGFKFNPYSWSLLFDFPSTLSSLNI